MMSDGKQDDARIPLRLLRRAAKMVRISLLRQRKRDYGRITCRNSHQTHGGSCQAMSH